ncbi:MAG: hypothetical protein JW811_04010 [Clostridiales bacterium]|nr:hypothetical protein [Clostridiales bacterium]
MKKSLQTAVYVSGGIIVSLILLNRLTSSYPWCIYPIFGILWWPLSAYFLGRREPLHYAVYGTALLYALFLLIYLFSSPGAHPWFLYPMLGVFWWPLSVWGSMVGAKRFSVTATLYIALMLLVINLLSSPGFWWWLCPAVPVLWWPAAVYLKDRNRKESETQ